MTRADDYLAAKGHRTLLLNGTEATYSTGVVRSLTAKRKTAVDGVERKRN